MKKILLFAFLLFAGGLFAQTPYDTVNVRDPQNFVEMTSVDTAYFQLIGRKANLNRRMSLTTLKNWILTGVSGIDTVYWSGDTLNILQGLTLWQAVADDNSGLFDADNNNDTIRVSTALLRAALQLTGGAYGMTITSSSTPITATSTGTTAGVFSGSNSGTNTYLNVADIVRLTSGTAAAGLGGRIRFSLEADNGGSSVAGYLGVKWTSAAFASPTSAFEVRLLDSGTEYTRLSLAGSGQLTLDGYAANALNNVDSSLYVLAVDATGDVHTRAASGLGGDGNGIYDGSGSLTSDTRVNGNLSDYYLQLDSIQYLEVKSYDNSENYTDVYFGQGYSQIDNYDNNPSQVTYFRLYPDNSDIYHSGGGETTGMDIRANSYTGIYMDGSSFSKVGAYALEGRFKVSNGAGSGNNDYLNIHAPDTIANGYIELFEKYRLANATPSTTNADTSFMVWIGNGSTTTPSFIEMASISGGGGGSQTLSTSNDTLTISGGNTVKLPITELLRDSVTTTTMTIDLETRYQKVVQIDMATATNLTLTINNPTNAGVYTFHFIGTSGTDNVTWPAAFLDAAGTALGTDALTTGTMYTCYYSSTDAKYYCK